MPESTDRGHMGDLLSALLDDELEPATAAAAEEHVATCGTCRDELAATAAIRDLLRNLPLLDPPFGLVQKVRRRDRHGPMAWLAAAAVAAAVFVLAVPPQSDSVTPPLASFSGLAADAEQVDFETAGLVEGGLDAPYQAPSELPEGFTRQGLFDRGSAIQVVYTDGRYTLSVFEQAGSLDSDNSPVATATTVRTDDGFEGWARRWLGVGVVVWEAGPLVYTLVGDAPLARLVRVAASLPEPRPLSAGQRLLREVRALPEVLSGRR